MQSGLTRQHDFPPRARGLVDGKTHFERCQTPTTIMDEGPAQANRFVELVELGDATRLIVDENFASPIPRVDEQTVSGLADVAVRARCERESE